MVSLCAFPLVQAVNPRYVLKNWMAESAVQKAERNDFSEVRWLTFLHLCLLILNMSYFKHTDFVGTHAKLDHCQHRV